MKHIASMCAHGGMQQWGIDFWETYRLVVNWIVIRTVLAIVSIHSIPTKSINFVLAFPQTKLAINVYI
eukprot:14149142-Ditylum_brightwellii.AAC.3